jgi:tripartite-type tricarboxylate transporter receptor subunit TctC
MKDVLAYFFKSLTICMAAGFCFIATAQNFPSKPIKIVVPFGPGGVADLTARIVAQKMGSKIDKNWQILAKIDNKTAWYVLLLEICSR